MPGEVLVPGGLPMRAPGVPETGLAVPLAVPEETPEGEDTAPPTAALPVAGANADPE